MVSNPATRDRLWTLVQKQSEKESEQLFERGSGRYEEGEMDRKEPFWQSGKDAPWTPPRHFGLFRKANVAVTAFSEYS